MTSAIIVKTQSDKKGYVYYKTLGQLQEEKVQVHVIDDKFQETGEKLLCQSNKLTPIGYKD